MGNVVKQGRNIMNVIPQKKDLVEQIRESDLPQEKKEFIFEKLSKLGAISEEIDRAKAEMAEINHRIRRSEEYKNKMKAKAYTKSLEALIGATRHELRGALQTYDKFDIRTKKSLSLDV